MKRFGLACVVTFLFFSFVFQPTVPAMAGESGVGSPILRVGQRVVTAGTDDTMKQQEEEKQFREAREVYEREIDLEQRRAKFEHLNGGEEKQST
jgi:hypothetical protein